MNTYRVRIYPETAPDVWRVLEFSARHTLHDVHRAIQDAFELDDDHLYAFFMSGRHWDKASEIACPEAASGRAPTDRVRLVELGLASGRRFSYVFDFGDELWHWLEVESVSHSDAPPGAPRLVQSKGDAPLQYPNAEEDLDAEDGDEPEEPDVSALVPLANELIRLLVSDEDATRDADKEDTDDTDDTDDDPALDLAPEVLKSAHAVALDLAARLEQDEERFWAVDEATEYDLMGLLVDLPFDLARAGMVDEGAELALALSFVDPGNFLGDRAILLADAGRREEALAQVTENLKSLPFDVWVEIKAGDVYASLGEPGRAEAQYRSVLGRSDDRYQRAGALDRLVELLSCQDRDAEARALVSAEEARERRNADTVQRITPKVGRNDPCPCGSGNKYKKCCLA